MPLPYNSVVTLYHDIPLDPMYEHTILFETKAAQLAYFSQMEITSSTTFRNISYIRHHGGVIRLETSMSLLTNCNYLLFYNPIEYEDVGFYCFVDNITYINENTVEIAYTIDHMQTWMHYYQLNACYVEREHVSNDALGANRVNEGLDTGDYVCPAIEKIDEWDSVYSTEDADVIQNTTFVIIATQAPDGSQSSYQYNGIASSAYITFAYSVSGLQDVLDAFSAGVTQSLEPIISIGMFPSYFKPNVTSPIVPKLSALQLDQSIGLGGFMAFNPQTMSYDSYVPINNKLYQYPYNFMVFESPDGSTVNLKYENFQNNNSHQFVTTLAVVPDLETSCAPKNYEGNYGANLNKNMHYALYSKGYPYCAVASDAFSAWWAQNRYSMPIAGALVDSADAITSAMSTQSSEASEIQRQRVDRRGEMYGNDAAGNTQAIGSSQLGAALGGIMKSIGSNVTTPSGMLIVGGKAASLAGNLAELNWSAAGDVAYDIGMQLASIQGHKAVPDTLVTKANNGGVNHYMEMDCYKIHYVKIRPEYARIIDNYFSCYGYAIHKVKVPNITSRTRWNYIKTKGCTLKKNIAGDRFIPMEAERIISAVYDKGITFWHDPSHIHDYTDGYGNLYSNPIVS